MHVRYVALALAVTGVAFYNFGHSAGTGTLSGPSAVQPAMAAGASPREVPPPAAEPAPAPSAMPVPVAAPAPFSAPAPAAPPAGHELAQSQQAPSRTPAAAPRPQVDESALRYFAAQGDTRRLEAELARLRALYPEWKPPTDLTFSGQASDTELERMWKLFSEGKIAEARAAIAQRSSAEPGWRAPDDLLAQLDLAEAGQRLINASNARQAEQVIRIGTETPALLTCANVDALWRVAEAFVQTAKPERARDAYAYVLTNCTTPAERIGTMQKALATLPDALTTSLLAQERDSEFASIRDEMARRRIGQAAQDPKIVVAAEDLKRIEDLSAASATPDDAILLGFYAFHHGEPVKAETFFKTALSRNGGAKAAEGVVLALGANKKYQEAEELGSQWLEAGPANRKAYLDVITPLLTQEPPPRLEPAVIARITKTVGTDRYAPGAAGIGWYAYNAGQIAPAETWFATSLSWDRAYEPAAYGLALVRQRLRDTAGLRRIVAEWGPRSERIAVILDPRRARTTREPERARDIIPLAPDMAEPRRAVSPRATASYAEPLPPLRTERPARRARIDELDYEPAPRVTTDAPARRASRGSCGAGTSGAAAVRRGWCLLNLKRPAAAAAAFEAGMRSSDPRVAADAAAGKTYAKLQQGLTSEASAAAASTALPPARRRELSALLLTENFYVQYEAKDYDKALTTLAERSRLAPESTDLMLMRGWSYFHLGRYDDASKVFTALYKATNSSQALAGLTAIRDVTRRNRY